MQLAGRATPDWEGEWGGGGGARQREEGRLEGGGGEVGGKRRGKAGSVSQAADLPHLGRFPGNRLACSRRPRTATFLGQPPPSPAEGDPFVPSPRDLANISRLRDEQQYDSFYFSSWILPPAQEKKEEAYSLREERTGEAFWEVWERVSEGCLPPGCAACGGYHSPSIPTPPSGPPVAPAAL